MKNFEQYFRISESATLSPKDYEDIREELTVDPFNFEWLEDAVIIKDERCLRVYKYAYRKIPIEHQRYFKHPSGGPTNITEFALLDYDDISGEYFYEKETTTILLSPDIIHWEHYVRDGISALVKNDFFPWTACYTDMKGVHTLFGYPFAWPVITPPSIQFSLYNYYCTLTGSNEMKFFKVMDAAIAGWVKKGRHAWNDGLAASYAKKKREILGDENLTTDDWIDVGMSNI